MPYLRLVATFALSLSLASCGGSTETALEGDPLFPPDSCRNEQPTYAGYPYVIRCDTTFDRRTGLTWQRPTDTPTAVTFAGAEAACDALTIRGVSDFRLPTIRELQSIVDYDGIVYRTDAFGFPSVYGGFLYSRTEESASPGSQWLLEATEGASAPGHNISGSIGYLCVRGPSAIDGGVVAPAWTPSADGLTVTDTSSGLVWQRDVDAGSYTDTQAIAYCASLTLGAYDDFRLPTIHELLTLVDYGRSDPAIDPSAFPNTPSGFFITSTPDVFQQDRRLPWDVDFTTGETFALEGKFGSGYDTLPHRVRCVRR